MLHVNDATQARAGSERNTAFLNDVVDGLSRVQKTLPCRYFYDDRGSDLFEQITDLPEYYPTRTEASVLGLHAAEMMGRVPDGTVLVEFGSGSSRKTELLLQASPALRAYVMIDVSAGALAGARIRLRRHFPTLDIRPVVADFSNPLSLDADLRQVPKIGFFPGSTIGNLPPPKAQRLLRLFLKVLAPDGRLIVGVDLKKDEGVLLPAYNDAAGVTAAFNLNLLERINRELGANFDLRAFRHHAIYNRGEGRIEMRLASTTRQTARIAGHVFDFEENEDIHTENSYKYGIEQFRALATWAGWKAGKVWTDPAQLFSVHELNAR